MIYVGLPVGISEYEFQNEILNGLGEKTMNFDLRGTCRDANYIFRWTKNPGTKELTTVDASNVVVDG